MKRQTTVLSYTLLSGIALVVSFPILWLLLTSFKTYADIYAYPIVYFPKNLTIEHYINISELNIFKHLFNSLIISLGSMLSALLVGIFPAYAFARYKFAGRNALLLLILLSQMFPMVVFLIPIFKLWKDVYLLNTMVGLIISYLPFLTPLVIVFMRGFFSSLSGTLEEAARIDGCNFIQTFIYIVFPTALPGIIAIGTYSFLFAWSELLFAMQILVDEKIQSIPVFLSMFVGEYQTRWGELFAGSVISMIFPLILFLFLQRFLVSGLTQGAVKE